MKKVRLNTLLSATAMASGVLFAPWLATEAAAQTASTSAPPPSTSASAAAQKEEKSSTVVIVRGRKDAKHQQMKSNSNVSILSADDLQHTAVHNAAEVVGLMPGVNVMNTGNSFIGGLDGAARGEGRYVSIRNMNPEYNVNLVNGVEVATAQPYSRGVELNLIPPSALQTVILNKMTMPNMDADAIGGTIDFRTPSAFDFPAGHNGSIDISYNDETEASKLGAKKPGYGNDGIGGGIAADYGHRFGASNEFGLYLSAYFKERNYAASEFGGAMEASGGDRAFAYAYVDANGNIPTGMTQASDLISTGFNIGVTWGETKLWGNTIALDYRPDANTSYFLHLSYSHESTTQDNSLNQVVGENNYNQLGVAPITSGPNQNAIAVGDGLYQTIIPYISNRLWYETNPEQSDLVSTDFGMKKVVGNWEFKPSAFYSFGRNDRPDHMELWTTSIPTGGPSQQASPYGGTSLLSYDSNNIPVAHLPPDLLGLAQNPGTMPAPCCYELTAQESQQFKIGTKWDAIYDANFGPFSSIDFGFKYVLSMRHVRQRDYTVSRDPQPTTDIAGDGNIVLGYLGGFPTNFANYLVPVINQNALVQRFDALVPTDQAFLAASDQCGGDIANNENCDTLKGSEAVAATYVMGYIEHGDVEIIPGIRYESTVIHNTYWVQGAEEGFQSNETHYSKAFPSVFLNYRPDGGTVYRAGIWTAYTRPPFFQLGGSSTESISYSGPQSTGTKIITINEGNPRLKPIESLNFDLNGAWQTQAGGYLSVGLFYKKLSNYIYDSGSGYVNTTGALQTTGSTVTEINQPLNGGSGTVKGIELDAQQALSILPQPLDGFSVGGNLTFQSSKVSLTPGGKEDVTSQNAPNMTSNLGLYYSKGPLSFDMTYHFQAASLANYSVLGQGPATDLWVRPTQHLDAHIGYVINSKTLFDISMTNLLNNYSYWSHIGKDNLAISDIVQSGSTILATVKYKY